MSHLPVAEYLLNPDKLMAFLKGKTEEQVPAKSPVPTKKATRSAIKRPPGGVRLNAPTKTAESVEPSALPPKKVEFSINSPLATSVKLVGEFTHWEAHPIEMAPSHDGIWFAVVPLQPGSYSYRFIVDGEWCDDPSAVHRVPNPFGSEDAVVRVS